MPALNRISALSLSRSTIRPALHHQIRHAHVGTVSSKIPNGAKADWGYQWKKVGGVAMMYFPVVGVVMFWPYIVEPIMEVVEKTW